MSPFSVDKEFPRTLPFKCSSEPITGGHAAAKFCATGLAAGQKRYRPKWGCTLICSLILNELLGEGVR